MVTEPPQVRTGDSLREVVDAVVSTRLNRAVALDEAGHVVGVVTDAELIARLTPALHPGLIRSLMHHIHFTHGGEGSERVWHQLTGKRAEDFMVRDIVIAHEDDPIRDVLAVVVEKQRQIVPVVGESGQLAGMTDRIDLLRVLIGI
jgi:CBS domain-containing protein